MIDVRWMVVAYVAASVVLRVVVGHLGSALPAWGRSRGQAWITSLLRFIYYIGFSYAALFLGVVPSSYLGLAGAGPLAGNCPVGGDSPLRSALASLLLTLLPDLPRFASLSALFGLGLLAAWWGYGRFKRLAAGTPGPDAPVPAGIFGSRPEPLLVAVAYQQVHWAFYRGAIWLVTGDLYLGVAGGVLLVGMEWFLSPDWRRRLLYAPAADNLLIGASLLVSTSVIFYFVPNFWLLVPAHWLLALLCRWAGRVGSGHSLGEFVQG